MDKLDNDTLLKIMAEMTMSNNKAITESTTRIDKLEKELETCQRIILSSYEECCYKCKKKFRATVASIL